MRTRCLSILVALTVGTIATAADFPPFEQLPARTTLPDPLTMLDGTKVTTVDAWQQKRAPELRALFQHYMYGVLPEKPNSRGAINHREDREYFGGKATLREVEFFLGNAQGLPTLHLLVVIPNKCSGPAPVFVGLNFGGNHALLPDPKIRLSKAWIPKRYPGTVDDHATEASRGIHTDAWSLEQTIDRGYAVVTCYGGDIDPDKPDFTDGVHPHFKSSDDENTKWGTVAAWAWGLQRLVDYVEMSPEFDREKIIAFGHSRLGKTALVAAAFDPRIDMAIPNQAGCGGTAPSRGTVGESVERINTSFPHWFCGNFKHFNKEPARLPFDQHCLIALCAPRPVLLPNAVEDQWANPDGQFEMLVAASPVYQLFGDSGTAASDKPPMGKLLTHKLGYRIREGKHSTTPEDWRMYCDYADAQFGKPK